MDYDEKTLKKMASPYIVAELKNALNGVLLKKTIYKLPVSKLKKHEVYHELLNIKYNFSNLKKREVPVKAVKKVDEGEKEINALKKEANKLTTIAVNLEEKARRKIKGKFNDEAVKKYEDAKKLADEANKKVIDKIKELK